MTFCLHIDAISTMGHKEETAFNNKKNNKEDQNNLIFIILNKNYFFILNYSFSSIFAFS